MARRFLKSGRHSSAPDRHAASLTLFNLRVLVQDKTQNGQTVPLESEDGERDLSNFSKLEETFITYFGPELIPIPKDNGTSPDAETTILQSHRRGFSGRGSIDILVRYDESRSFYLRWHASTKNHESLFEQLQ